jgi:hypothetical protein
MKKCWASILGDCDNKISKEHLISNSILDPKINVIGFEWCKDTPKTIGASSLTSTFLCQKHNAELSPCDAEILKFKTVNDKFNKMMGVINKYGFQKKKIPVIYHVNGMLFEKWFCKTLINVSLLDKQNPIENLPEILPYIFRDKEFQEPFGLNSAAKINQVIIHNYGTDLGLGPLYNNTDSGKIELIGGFFTFQGLHFILLLPGTAHPIQNNKLNMRLNNPRLAEDWNNLDLHWHQGKINQTAKIGRKTYEVQSLIIDWN